MYQVGMNNASLPIHAAQHSNCMQASMGEQTNALHPPGKEEETWDKFLGSSGLGLLPLQLSLHHPKPRSTQGPEPMTRLNYKEKVILSLNSFVFFQFFSLQNSFSRGGHAKFFFIFC